jgi:hypothetical protein
MSADAADVMAEILAHLEAELSACRARRTLFVALGRDEAAGRAAADVVRFQRWTAALAALRPASSAAGG